MEISKQQELISIYPEVFQRYKDYFNNNFYFNCGDGWFELLKELISKIKLLDTKNRIIIFQIKEKFGGLRFYVDNSTTEIDDLINHYEERSYKTCELCGNEGVLRRDFSWWVTLCDSHYNEKKIKSPSKL